MMPLMLSQTTSIHELSYGPVFVQLNDYTYDSILTPCFSSSALRRDDISHNNATDTWYIKLVSSSSCPSPSWGSGECFTSTLTLARRS